MEYKNYEKIVKSMTKLQAKEFILDLYKHKIVNSAINKFALINDINSEVSQ